MGRPRKHNKGLPNYVRIRHGSYTYKDQKLCRVESGLAAMYDALAKRLQTMDITMVPAAVASFKRDYLPTLSPGSRPEADRRLSVLANEFEQFRVDAVTPLFIRNSIKQLYPDKPGAAGHYKATASRFFRWCVEEAGLRNDNPCREVWIKKAPKHKSKWTDELYLGIRDQVPPMHQCYMDLSVLLYQRATDVRLLRRSQRQDGVIRFEPTKTERSSSAQVDIPETPEIQVVLDRAAAISREWGVVCPFVIHTRQGTAYTRSGVYSAIRRAAEQLGATGLNPKDLRPYAASRAKQQGASLEQLKIALAHTSITTTEGYVQQHTVPVSPVVVTLPEKPK